MGDFRYKINGTHSPFDIKLYQSNGTEINQFDGHHTYSDYYICGFVSDLNPGDYYITATDNIGLTVTGSTFTIPDDYNFYAPPTINYNLLGDVNNYSTNNHFLTDPKHLNASQSLSTDQAVDVTFILSASGNSGSIFSDTEVYGCVVLYCNNIEISNINAWCDLKTTSNTITLNPNDTICYDVCAYNNDSNAPSSGITYCTYAGIKIDNIISSGTLDVIPNITTPSHLDVYNSRTYPPAPVDYYPTLRFSTLDAGPTYECGDIEINPSLVGSDSLTICVSSILTAIAITDPGNPNGTATSCVKIERDNHIVYSDSNLDEGSNKNNCGDFPVLAGQNLTYCVYAELTSNDGDVSSSLTLEGVSSPNSNVHPSIGTPNSVNIQ